MLQINAAVSAARAVCEPAARRAHLPQHGAGTIHSSHTLTSIPCKHTHAGMQACMHALTYARTYTSAQGVCAGLSVRTRMHMCAWMYTRKRQVGSVDGMIIDGSRELADNQSTTKVLLFPIELEITRPGHRTHERMHARTHARTAGCMALLIGLYTGWSFA